MSELINSRGKLVYTSILTNYDGSEFETKEELITSGLISYKFEGYHNGVAEYILKLNFQVQAVSKQYWGRDDDTK